MTDTMIKVRDLHKRYGDNHAVRGINFAVGKGEIFGLLGPNGAGKTTTIEMIEGLREIEEGEVELMGQNVVKERQKIKQQIGVQLQSTSLMERLNVRETLAMFRSFYDTGLDPEQLIEQLSLQEKADTLTMNLSGGQKQRLSIALALINDPQVVFLDEPTTGLDPASRRALWAVIRGIRDAGKTILLTTHYMEEAEELCDTVAIMDHGQILNMDSPAQMIAEHFKGKTLEVLFRELPEDGWQWLAQDKQVDGYHVDEESARVVLHTNQVQVVLATLLEAAERQQVTFQDLRVRSATLEDVFLKLTGSTIRD